MKTCSDCKSQKDLSEFRKNKNCAGGLYPACKACHGIRDKRWRLANPDKVRASKAKLSAATLAKIAISKQNWARENAAVCSARQREWNAKNPTRRAEIAAKFQRKHPGKVNANTAMRRARKKRASPPWLTKDQKKQIQLFYIKASELTEITGIPHEVDHIMPLKGVISCGLHVPWNLQILTKAQNCLKNNKEIVK